MGLLKKRRGKYVGMQLEVESRREFLSMMDLTKMEWEEGGKE